MQSNFRNKQSSQWPLKKAITSGYHDSLRTLNFFPGLCCIAIQGVSFEILLFQMAVVIKLCISDPKLVKPKCV